MKAGEESWNELPLARQFSSKHLATRHEEIILNPKDLIEDLHEMIFSIDEPYAGGLPSWYVFKLMGARVKVGLTGTGGDELFGNYGKWVPFEWKIPYLQKYGKLNNLFKNFPAYMVLSQQGILIMKIFLKVL